MSMVLCLKLLEECNSNQNVLLHGCKLGWGLYTVVSAMHVMVLLLWSERLEVRWPMIIQWNMEQQRVLWVCECDWFNFLFSMRNISNSNYRTSESQVVKTQSTSPQWCYFPIMWGQIHEYNLKSQCFCLYLGHCEQCGKFMTSSEQYWIFVSILSPF